MSWNRRSNNPSNDLFGVPYIVELLVLHIEDIVLHRFFCDGMDGLLCIPQKPKEASALSGVEVE